MRCFRLLGVLGFSAYRIRGLGLEGLEFKGLEARVTVSVSVGFGRLTL